MVQVEDKNLLVCVIAVGFIWPLLVNTKLNRNNPKFQRDFLDRPLQEVDRTNLKFF